MAFHVCAVGGTKIARDYAVVRDVDFQMLAGDARIIDDDVAAGAAADHRLVFGEQVLVAHKGAPTVRRRMVSETVSLPSRGTFHLSLTVLRALGGRGTQRQTETSLRGNHIEGALDRVRVVWPT